MYSEIRYSIKMYASNSYYTLSIAYCVYCTRPEGTKHSRANAVKYAIHYQERVISRLLNNNHAQECAGILVFKLSLFSEPVSVSTIMAKASKRAALGRGKENTLPISKQFNFDLENGDFEDMCLGFVPKNTVADTEKCVRLFQSWVGCHLMVLLLVVAEVASMQ